MMIHIKYRTSNPKKALNRLIKTHQKLNESKD